MTKQKIRFIWNSETFLPISWNSLNCSRNHLNSALFPGQLILFQTEYATNRDKDNLFAKALNSAKKFC